MKIQGPLHVNIYRLWGGAECPQIWTVSPWRRKHCIPPESQQLFINKYYIFWVCVCRLRYPACKPHAPYYIVIWPVRLYHIFPHYLIKGAISRAKKVTEYRMCVLIFCRTSVWNISYCREKWARCDQNVYWFLTFRCPCIVINSYNKTNLMH